jgi:hypothetical protein
MVGKRQKAEGSGSRSSGNPTVCEKCGLGLCPSGAPFQDKRDKTEGRRQKAEGRRKNKLCDLNDLQLRLIAGVERSKDGGYSSLPIDRDYSHKILIKDLSIDRFIYDAISGKNKMCELETV